MSALSKEDVNASLQDLRTKKAMLDMIEVATVAAAGSDQTNAGKLSAGINAVTAADGTKGVILPRGKKDKTVRVINTVSNQALKVYPDAGGQINALTVTTGAFTQAAGSTATYVCDADLHWYVSANSLTGTATTASTAELNTLAGVTAGTVTASKAVVAGASKNVDTLAVALVSVGAAGIQTPITANAGGTQAAAFALSATASVHEVTIVGSAADSVKLPPATGSGNVHWVKNSAAANALQLFGAGTDTIDGIATATGVVVAAGKSRMCVDTAAGKWQSLLGA